MLYDVKTPGQYFDALEDDWRKETLEQIRSIIRSKAPHLVEGINYKMLSYSDKKGVVFHLNAQKNYVSLYVGDAKKIDEDGGLLEGIEVGKGCIRFKKSVSVAYTRIDEFIVQAVDFWKSGKDIDC